MVKKNLNIKYTAVLPAENIAGLKELAAKDVIPSINQGIREAVEQYIVIMKKNLYDAEMIKAATDPDYMERTLQVQKEFLVADSEVDGNW